MKSEKPKKTFYYTVKIPITIKAVNTFEALAMAEETKRYVIERTGLTAALEKEEKPRAR